MELERDEALRTRRFSLASLASGYAGDAKEELPIGGYAALLGLFAASFAPLLVHAARARKLPRRIRVADVLLLGVATHKLTRILTRDWVTIPLRAPFTRYEGSDRGGEVNEKARGHGVRRALGDLATCPFCTGPWVASALVAGVVAAPRVTRTIAGTLAAVTVSDFLHHLYAWTKSRK